LRHFHLAHETGATYTFSNPSFLFYWIPTPDDVRALFDAIRKNDAETVASYIAHRKSVPEWRDRAGNTPLMMAVIHGPSHQKVIDLLLDNGADVNAQNAHGGNALARAAHFGHKDLVTKLLSLGADARMKDAAGQDAADWARLNGHADIAELIEKSAKAAGPKPHAPAP
jgi:uncharacterized protein